MKIHTCFECANLIRKLGNLCEYLGKKIREPHLKAYCKGFKPKEGS